MAFSNGMGDRVDDLRFRSPQSPRDESPFPGFTTPLRSNGTRMPPPASSNDTRASLPRRFTADSGRVPTMTSVTPTRGQDTGNQDLTPSVRRLPIHSESLGQYLDLFITLYLL